MLEASALMHLEVSGNVNRIWTIVDCGSWMGSTSEDRSLVHGHQSGPPLQHLQVGLGESLAHEGEGFGAAWVVVAGVGRAAGPLGGFRGADDGGGGFHESWIVDRRWWMVRRRLTIVDFGFLNGRDLLEALHVAGGEERPHLGDGDLVEGGEAFRLW